MVTVIFNEEMQTRDGVILKADVYLPSRTGKYPLIVLRSPYNSDNPCFSQFCADFCEQGIGVVCQAVRGTAASQGDFNISRQECDDGKDFLEWIATRDYCNGSIVTNGESYPGHTQWQVARHGDDVLKGITPHNAPLNFYKVAIRPNGAWCNGFATFWALGQRARRIAKSPALSWDKAQWLLPLETIDEKLGLGEWNLWRQWMEHVTEDDFWHGENDAMSLIQNVTAPAFITGGWFDCFLPQTLEAFSRMRKESKTERARKLTRCIIEPLDHNMATHDIDYGENHLDAIIAKRNRFMAGMLTDQDKDPLPELPPMRYFLMGKNEWRETNEWPLPETRYTKLYIHGECAANSLSGKGTLSFDEPANEEFTDAFYYNPLDPVPTCGGNNLGISAGQKWQDTIEKRSDVLFYTSTPLDKELTITGNVEALIYAATDGHDTDFTVKLCDVCPDGRSVNLCDGIIRGRFRNGLDKEELLEPGKVYPFTIDCWATAWTFKEGHSIRVQISSSNFPRFDRNLNTGLHLTKSTELRVAHQQIYHTAEYPSCVVLPVI